MSQRTDRPAGKGRHRDIDFHHANLQEINLNQLADRLHTAYETGRNSPSARDGYKAHATGADSSRPGNPELLKVEADAVWRLTHQNWIDTHDRIVQTALDYFAEADRALRACQNKLTQLARLQDDHDLDPTPGCWALARIGSWDPIAHTVIIAGEPRPLGAWAYRFHRNNGRLPTLDECKRHVRGQKIHIKAS